MTNLHTETYRNSTDCILLLIILWWKDLNNTVNNANHRNIGEERLKKNRKKDSELPSERNSQEKEKNSNRSSNKIQANLYPEFNPKELLGTTKSVLVSNHNGWKEFWIQPDQSKLDDLENMLQNEELLGRKSLILKMDRYTKLN